MKIPLLLLQQAAKIIVVAYSQSSPATTYITIQVPRGVHACVSFALLPRSQPPPFVPHRVLSLSVHQLPHSQHTTPAASQRNVALPDVLPRYVSRTSSVRPFPRAPSPPSHLTGLPRLAPRHLLLRLVRPTTVNEDRRGGRHPQPPPLPQQHDDDNHYYDPTVAIK